MEVSLKGITNKLKGVQSAVSVIVLLTLLILIFVQVLLRYVFNLPLMGIEELMLFPTIWLYMLGAANASEERSHIVVDIADVFIKSQKFLKIIHFIKNILSALIALMLTYYCFIFFQYSLNLWKLSALLSIPMFLAESALFIGLLLMTLYSIVDLIKNMNSFISKGADKHREGS